MAKISLALSGLFLVSACLVNPLALKLYRENPVNYEDVGFIALLWNLGFTSVFLALRFFLSRSSSLAPNWILLLATCALIIWSDRMLLAWSGRPHWVTDPVLHYRHRPNTQRTWGWNNQFAIKEIEQKSLRLNRHGHHDDDFAVAKPQGQFRGLFFG
jgi:hypothetical protein